MTEGWTKQTINAPLPFNGGGIKISGVWLWTILTRSRIYVNFVKGQIL